MKILIECFVNAIFCFVLTVITVYPRPLHFHSILSHFSFSRFFSSCLLVFFLLFFDDHLPSSSYRYRFLFLSLSPFFIFILSLVLLVFSFWNLLFSPLPPPTSIKVFFCFLFIYFHISFFLFISSKCLKHSVFHVKMECDKRIGVLDTYSSIYIHKWDDTFFYRVRNAARLYKHEKE